jgi:Fe-S cluster biogenesis protein NfuA
MATAVTADGPPHTGTEALVERVRQLTERLETIDDPVVRENTHELIGAIIELYGEGLGRIFQALTDAGLPGEVIKDTLIHDGVVSSLLLIHDLYPVDLATRVNQGLEQVRPYMASHGGNVEVLSLDGGVLRMRLQGSCHGCAASHATLELALKRALQETAPDLIAIEVEGVSEPGQGTAPPGACA